MPRPDDERSQKQIVNIYLEMYNVNGRNIHNPQETISETRKDGLTGGSLLVLRHSDESFDIWRLYVGQIFGM
jgi:hypothetical protein